MFATALVGRVRTLIGAASDARERSFGYGDYSSPWHWVAGRTRWEYGASEGAGHKPYHWTEYVIARIEGRAPTWRRGVKEDDAVASAAFESRLSHLGWVRREQAHRDCVVVYKQGGVVFHAATYDRQRRDWGGKINCVGPIARFRKPEDFISGGLLTGVSILFYGPRWRGEAGGPPGVTPTQQRSDEWLHANAFAVG